MYYNENGVGSLDYIDNRNALSLEYGAAKFDPQVRFLEALQPEEADCISSSSERMEASGNHHDWSRGESGERTRSNSSSSSSVKELNNVVMQVLDSVRASGYDEDVCNEFREHFGRLPSRYTLNIDPHRHEDVLLHMELLMEAREAEYSSCCSSYGAAVAPIPQVHVRKVLLPGPSTPTADACSPGPSSSEGLLRRNGLQIPKPAFGSGSNLVGLGLAGSPKLNIGLGRSFSTPRLSTVGESSLSCSNMYYSIRRPAFGNFNNSMHIDDGYASEEDPSPPFGYEVTIATTDRQGLLKYFTSALSDSHLQLNIKEAHVFSTTDGMALEVFVVEGWSGDEAEELRQAVLMALDEKSEARGNLSETSRLRMAAEAIQYEDWAVEYDLLEFGEKLGKGSTGRLFKGRYLSQDVAIKIMEIDHCGSSGSDSDTQRSSPASERLQIFKQEVLIMRLVRHKNVVQFIGACSKWPKLCIVTELMAGGSVRDLLDNRRGGLDIASAIKVLRDAARGMDFLHKRGIVHRDMKAANLLIDEHDVVKVCDFGVARLKPTINSSEKDSFIATAEMTAETGTYRWMSPEVLQHRYYDHKADIYSFGITMWEVLTGDVPYAGLTPLQAAVGVVQRGLRPEIPTFVPEVMAALMRKCWHEDPSERPEFSEILALLEMMVITPPTLRRVVVSRRRATNASFRS